MLRRFEPHVPGLVYAALLTLVAMTAMNNQNNLLFWVFGAMLAALLISAVISTHMMRALHIRRVDPQHGRVDEPMVVRYAITNQSRILPAFNIKISERSGPARGGGDLGWRRSMAPAEAWVMHVAPRETLHGEIIFQPRRRGRVAFHAVQASTTFPFGLIRKSRAVAQSQHTLIYPQLLTLRRGILASASLVGHMGSKVSAHAGVGDDYFGTREYRSGDSLRHIAWKKSARVDDLISIDRARPSPTKLRIVLDLTTPTHKLQTDCVDDARELEERAISLAASLLHAAHGEDYEIGLSVLGVAITPIALRRNVWHLNKIMAALASIDLDGAREPIASAPVRQAERAGVIVVTSDRITPLAGHEQAIYFSARHLTSLLAEPKVLDRGHALDVHAPPVARGKRP